MNDRNFRDVLDAQGILVADGAMGTMLNARGVAFEHCLDELNLSDPALVGSIHNEYIQAGSELIKTNTFGANRFKLARHGLVDELDAINQAGVELAKKVVAGSFKDVFIAGDIGPLGVRLAPYGRIQPEEAAEAFKEQARALLSGGIHLFLIETMTDLNEVSEAIKAVKSVAPDLPVVASLTFTRDDRTLLGDDPEKVVRTVTEDGADIVGLNCSGGPAQLLRILKIMRRVVPSARFSVMPNAGWPEQVGGRIMYPAAADYFGDYVQAFRQNGAVILGGCCGTTPRHISALRQAVDLAPSIAVIDSAVPADDECVDCQPATEDTQPVTAQVKGWKIRGGSRDGSAARTGDPEIDRWGQPDEGSRCGCDRCSRQPDGAYAHEPLGCLPPDRGVCRYRDRPAFSNPRAQPVACAGGPAGGICAGNPQCVRSDG